MEFDTERLLDHLTQLEVAAQDLLEDKQSVVALDRKRNQAREARTAIKHRVRDKDPLNGDKTWMCYGNTFIKMRNEVALTILDESHKKLDEEIKSTRDLLKRKLNKVREIEGKSHAAGFNLKGLTAEEQKALHSLI